MKQTHQSINLGNPLANAVGNCYCTKKPDDKQILDELLNAMSKFSGTCWSPVAPKGGYSLMLNQCPGACGHVWNLNIQDHDVSSWLVNEINHRRFGDKEKT